MFKKIVWSKGSRNLDYGGEDATTDYLKNYGVTNLIYDPVAKTPYQNAAVLYQLQVKKADSATLCNVLKTPGSCYGILSMIKEYVKRGGYLYINDTAYIDEVRKLFQTVEIMSSMIVVQI